MDEIEKLHHKNTELFCNKIEEIKTNLKQQLNSDKVIAHGLKNNSCKALEDLQSGKVFSDDAAAENLRNTIEDSLKVSGMIGFFLLPGGSVGLFLLRKLLQSNLAARIGIEHLLTLSVKGEIE